MKYLREQHVGFHTAVINVPIISQAVLFDLQMLKDESDNFLLPNYYEMGYQACCKAFTNQKLHSIHGEQGNVGAGMGATIGKILGKQNAMKGGLGTCAIEIGDLRIGAIVAVNCFGDVIEDGKIIGGCLNNEEGSSIFADTESLLIKEYLTKKQDCKAFETDCKPQTAFDPKSITNTTLGIVVTNGKFDKAQLNRIATMAHDGYARSMKPSHTLFDGDTIFVLSTHRESGNAISNPEDSPTNFFCNFIPCCKQLPLFMGHNQ